MCLAGIIAIKLQRYLPLFAIFIVVLLVGLLIGWINSLIIVDQGANSFITTLGMMMLLRGIALVISDGKPVEGTMFSIDEARAAAVSSEVSTLTPVSMAFRLIIKPSRLLFAP